MRSRRLNAAIAGALLALLVFTSAACTSQSTLNGTWSFGPSLPPSSASPGASGVPAASSAPASAAPAASPS